MSRPTLPLYRWIKFPIAYLEDQDFSRLSYQARGLFLDLYLLAAKADSAGLICDDRKVFTAENILWQLRVQPEDHQFVLALLDDLVRSGFISCADGGYQVTRFLEEQGPADNPERLKWRKRTSEKRARVTKKEDREQESEQEIEGEKDEEADIEGHGVIPVTTPSPESVSLSDEKDALGIHPALEAWYEVTGIRLPKSHQAGLIEVVEENPDAGPVRERLHDCWTIWKDIARENRWPVNNPNVIMDLYPIPQLEDRMERTGWTWSDPQHERVRIRRLVEAGLIDPKEDEAISGSKPINITAELQALCDEMGDMIFGCEGMYVPGEDA